MKKTKNGELWILLYTRLSSLRQSVFDSAQETDLFSGKQNYQLHTTRPHLSSVYFMETLPARTFNYSGVNRTVLTIVNFQINSIATISRLSERIQILSTDIVFHPNISSKTDEYCRKGHPSHHKHSEQNGVSVG